MMNIIKGIFDENRQAVKKFAASDNNIAEISKVVEAIIKSCDNNGKIIVFGNGGSAADSQHMAAEFIVRFEKERKSIPCIALTTDTSILTATANDYDFSQVFSRQVESLARSGDVVVGISTSGNSKNVNKAMKIAAENGAVTVALTGMNGGDLAGLADIPIIVEEQNTARIQEIHVTIIHIICKLVEEALA